jgi:hypothetical protein
MAVQGFGPGDFIKLAEFAWDVYTNIRDSHKKFSKLDNDVEYLMASISFLNQQDMENPVVLYVSEDAES